MGSGDDVCTIELSDALGCCRTGVNGCLYGSDIAAYHNGNERSESR